MLDNRFPLWKIDAHSHRPRRSNRRSGRSEWRDGMEPDTEEFDAAIAELVFDGFSPEQIAEMARKSAEQAKADLDKIGA